MFSLLISSARCITSMGACQFNGQGGLFSFVTCSIKKKTKMRERERGQKKAARGLGWAAYIRSRTSCLGDQLRNVYFGYLKRGFLLESCGRYGSAVRPFISSGLVWERLKSELSALLPMN